MTPSRIHQGTDALMRNLTMMDAFRLPQAVVAPQAQPAVPPEAREPYEYQTRKHYNARQKWLQMNRGQKNQSLKPEHFQ
jgi:hypothetical protein